MQWSRSSGAVVVPSPLHGRSFPPTAVRSSSFALAFSRTPLSFSLSDQNECSDSRPDLCGPRLLRGSQYRRATQPGRHAAAAAVGTLVARARGASFNSGKICSEEIFVLRQEMNCLRTGSWSLGGHGRR